MKVARLLVLASILTELVFSLDAFALGLGDAKLRSQLNEPLRAEIALVGSRTDIGDPTAKVATAAEHRAVGIDAGGPWNQVKAALVKAADGAPVIRLTTAEAIREPVLDFLVVVENLRERVTRRYTLLLDPPGYALPITAKTKQRTTRPGPTRKADSAAARDLTGDFYGPVRRGDSLSKLGSRFRRRAGVSWAQMTWALFVANPDAFLDGDINKLRSGVKLKVPASADAIPWTHKEALALINAKPRQQTLAKRGETSAPPPVSAPPAPPVLDAPSEAETVVREAQSPPESDAGATQAPATQASAAENSDAQLRLLSADEVDALSLDDTVGMSIGVNETEYLRNLIVQAYERIQENTDEMLQSRTRLAALSEETTRLAAVVETKESEVLALKSQLANLRGSNLRLRAEQQLSASQFRYRLILETLVLLALVGVLTVMLLRASRARPQSVSNYDAPRQTQDRGRSAHSRRTRGKSSASQDQPRAEFTDKNQLLPDRIEVEHTTMDGDAFEVATAYFTYGYYEKAKEICEAFIKDNPAHADSRLLMLKSLHALGEKADFRQHAEAFFGLVDNPYDERCIAVAQLERDMFAPV